MLTNSDKINIIDYLTQHNIKAVLLYGANFDAVADSAQTVLAKYKKSSTFGDNIIHFHNAAVGQTSSLFDLMRTQNLLKQTQVIYVQNPTASEYADIKKALTDYQGQNFLLIRDQILSKTNALVKFFSDCDDLLAVIHYDDNQKQTTEFITQEINKRNLQLPPSQRALVQQTLQGQSRAAIRNYLDQITTAGKEAPTVLQDHVLPRDEPLIDSILACLAGDTFCLSPQGKNSEICKSPIATLRLLNYFLLRIEQLKRLMYKHASSVAQVANQLKPPIFYTQYSLYSNLSKRWSMEQIYHARYMIMKTNNAIKHTAHSQPLFHYILLCIVKQDFATAMARLDF